MPKNTTHLNRKGRPKGSKGKKTLEKEAILEHLRQRGMKVADNLFDSQLTIAQGIQFLFRVDKEFRPTGGKKKDGSQAGYWMPKKPELVTSVEEIRQYIENLVDLKNGDIEADKDPGAAYYFITVKEPNNHAIDSIHDRIYGKSKTIAEIDARITMPIPLLDKLPPNKKDKKNVEG